MERDFLSPEEFKAVQQCIPTGDWKDAVVYHKAIKKEVLAPDSRLALKRVERRDHVIQRLRGIVMPRVLAWLREQTAEKKPISCWFRYAHTEWLHYKKGMFFREHRDFEKYVCNGLVPYVGLLGLVDTARGGETKVEGTARRGSVRENGFVFFPGNVPHEATTVLEGEKMCLKMEFFVLFDSSGPQKGGGETIRVSSRENNDWRSFWSRDALSLVENYMASQARFENTDNVCTSREMAKTIYDVMMSIVDPRRQRVMVAKMDMVFPSWTSACLHDVFTCTHFLQNETRPGVILGSDADAWDFMQTWSRFPALGCALVVGLWYKNLTTSDATYRLYTIRDRNGGRCKRTIQASSTYVDYKTIRQDLLYDFVASKDMRDWDPSPVDTTGLEKKQGVAQGEILDRDWSPVIRTSSVQPSDEIERAEDVRGRATRYSHEMCNDEDGGYMEEYTVYEVFRIQIRWCLIRVKEGGLQK